MERRGFLKSGLVAGAGLLLARSGWSGGGIFTNASPPNIIIILTDDLGYGDIGCFGNEIIRTPNLDYLGTRGARLTNFYSSAPVCSPSRAGLLTGRYPPRTKITQVLFPSRGIESIVTAYVGLKTSVIALPKDEITLAEVLKSAGYRTCCIGKWHLGDIKGSRPYERGFEHYLGLLYSNDMVPLALYRNQKVIEPHPVNQDYLTRKYTEEALWFIKQNKNKPFFLYLAHTFPHIPLHCSPEFRGKSKAGIYGDCVEEIDWSAGRLIEALDSYGILNNTLIMFSSDNGPWWTGNPGYQRGRKGDSFEGGMRVPLIAFWPEQISAGQVINEPAMNIDLFSTSLSAAGVEIPKNRIIDGRNLIPLLSGKVKKSPHRFLYFYKGKNLEAVRMGDWKYQLRHYVHYSPVGRPQGPWLFNLKKDPNESYNVYDEYPEIVKELEAEIKSWNRGFNRGL